MEDILVHHGIKGMKWGVRRYQNKDGSLTALGRRKLEGYRDNAMSKAKAKTDSYNKKAADTKEYLKDVKTNKAASKRLQEDFEWLDSDEKTRLANKKGLDGWALAETLFNNGRISKTTRDRLALDAFAEERVDHLTEQYSYEINKAKRYTTKYENLRIMDLDSKAATMDYRSIKRSIKNA